MIPFLRTTFVRRSFLFVLLFGCAIWPAAARAQSNPFANCKNLLVEKREMSNPPVEGMADVREWRLAGRVKVICDDLLLQAEEIRWRTDQDMVYATGDVHFEQKGARIDAEKAEMNKRTRLGSFIQASGHLELLNEKADKTLFGIQEPYILFWADRIDKVESDKYVLLHGGFTSCRQPTPRWDMTASHLTLVPGEHAILTNMVLRVKDVPLFYLPGLYYPINHTDRATGVLLPTYGSSTIRGMSLSNAFFWAVNRSQDVTFYHDLFTKTGQGLGGEFRYVGDAGASGNARVYMIAEHDILADDQKTIITPAHKSYDIRGNVNQGFGKNVRLSGHVNYFTDISTQQLYQQSIYDLSLRTRSYGASVSGGSGRYRVSGQFESTDVFYGARASRYGGAPQASLTVGEKPIGRSPVYLSGSLTGGYLVRQDDIENPLSDRSLWRIDGSPRISVPVSNLPALQLTATAAWRYTFWTESLDPDLGQISTPIQRQIMELSARAVGPVFSRIWRTPDREYATGFKHLIEPNFSVGWLSNYEQANRLVQLDGVDTLVTGTTTVNYGLTNRLLAKRTSGTREILTADLRQTYYTNSLAAQYDSQYMSSFAGLYTYVAPPSPFSPAQLSITSRPSDTTSAQFRMEYDTKYMAPRSFSASATVDQPVADITVGWSKRQVIPGLPGYSDPDTADHFLNVHTTIKDPDNGIGGTLQFNYDMLRGYFLQRRYRMFYNSQCCGVAFDFQTVDLTHFSLIPNARSDRRMSISFTLAGIGTFSNPLGAFGGATGSR